jgi:effector-binding domain-containing protein
MVYEIGIIDEAAQEVAAVRIHTDLSHIGEDIGRGFGTLMGAMVAQAATASGPPLVVYHDVIDADTDGDIEVCVPLAGPMEPDGGVAMRELEGGSMASTLHRGPYDEIGAAYEAVMDWISSEGHTVMGPPREIYLNDPQTVRTDDLLTRIEFPIAIGAR